MATRWSLLAGTRHQDLIRSGASEHELMRAAESLEQQKVLMSQAQTRIKLLASARTSEQAEELRVSIRRLAKSVGPELTVTEFDVLADRISDRRELFIQQAKKDMSLPS